MISDFKGSAYLTQAMCCAGLMKFGKLLQSRAEELKSTGLTEHFLRYKALKKTLKQISKEEDQQTEAQNGDAAGQPTSQRHSTCLSQEVSHLHTLYS